MKKRLAVSVLSASIGALAMLASMVSCDEDPMTQADAADCNCDPAEPPLAGRIVRTTSMMEITSPNGVQGAVAACPLNGILLGGGCRLTNITKGIHLKQADPESTGGNQFICAYENTTGLDPDETIVATAICLVPPQ